MSRSELHNWECAIEELSGDNADKMLAIAQDIYNTAYARGKNYMSLEQESVLDKIRTEIEQIKLIMNDEIINHNRKDLINFVNGLNQSLNVIDKYRTEREEENE